MFTVSKEALKVRTLVPVTAPVADRWQAICVQGGIQNGISQYSTHISLEVARHKPGKEHPKTNKPFHCSTALRYGVDGQFQTIQTAMFWRRVTVILPT
jgi:hypothetical protein